MQASNASMSSSSVIASLLLVVPTTRSLLPDGGCFLVSTAMACATSLKNLGPMRDHPSSFSIPEKWSACVKCRVQSSGIGVG